MSRKKVNEEIGNSMDGDACSKDLQCERILVGGQFCACGRTIDDIMQVVILNPWRLKRITAEGIPVSTNEIHILHEVMSGLLIDGCSVKNMLMAELDDMTDEVDDLDCSSHLWDESEISAFRTKIAGATEQQISGVVLALRLHVDFGVPLERVFNIQEGN